CSPHNPTGRVWTRDELSRMAAICQRHGVKVISDDIHMDVSFARYLPWSEVAQDDSWALVSSGSKSFNIPALGGAYAFIPNADARAAYLQRLKAAHGLSSPPILGVLAHISAYRDGGAWLDALQTLLVEKYRVAIMRGDTYGPEGTGYLRLNVGCPRSKVEQGLDALIGALQDLLAG
ncbi:TPA: aminotransferase class I/II-fold pyridoxal phosphate-dependent enzyme, partial [Aeromonas salmonicida]|nr:aminotransferase class I/II-fold pyridoxal phosphate-dependent enzyme [Aeromonas salmonicida subsp. salmonicida]HDN9543282.1 aminotransferase class I/II-fold pyridoxal phosphate-dependent enzyme [Aeromonas salmonicida]ELI6438384.1 aminotransferase class I/II-fold pyridoxal phosphate-dependent enzyme [Aeromonas salmonicida subsp. salmonicida]ELI6442371.1 aminotransferase class I/II-fold pyridoxal phosphate-dependent enzyme [Aeromonas salmonicida subsp. salmonicida]ELM3642757.1 aminotransferas